MGIVGKEDLDRKVLSGLCMIEINADVLDNRVQVRELHLMIERCQAEFIVAILVELDILLQVDRVEMRSREVVEVEYEHLKCKRKDANKGKTPRQMDDGVPIQRNVLTNEIDDILKERRHRLDYKQKPAPPCERCG